jgi:hypothetical protein
MGGTVYSSISRSSYAGEAKSKTVDDIFKQNELHRIHKDMDPMGIIVRESRDSDVHPASIAVIIALDVTGSMGSIPERIVRKDLTHIMETLIEAGLPHLQIMFMAIGDHNSDSAPLQVGQFESGDQELAMWLENTWLERGGGGGSEESYPLAWLIGGRHTAIDCLEKRNQKGFLFTIGDEGFHKEYDVVHITGEPSQKPYTAIQLLDFAKEMYNVYHIHANYTSYKDNAYVLGQWRNLLGQNVLMAKDDAGIAIQIADTIKSSLRLEPVVDSDPAPDTSEKPNNIML